MSEDRMQRHLLGLAALAMVLSAAGCVKDPTSGLAGTPTRIVASYAKLLMTEGDTVRVTAELRDEQGAPLDIMPVASAPTPAVVDVVRQSQASPQAYLQVDVAGVAAGAGIIVLSYESLADTITVAVFPVTFDGAVSVKTAAGSVVTFDPAATTVDIDGVPARPLTLTADAITVIARNAKPVAAAKITLNNVVFLAGTADETPILAIDAEATPAIRGEATEPANNDPATAPTVAVNGAYVEGLISSTDADDFWAFTIAAGADVTIEVAFDGDGGSPDIDAYLLGPAPTSDNYCDLDDCSMGTGAQPETGTFTLAAGTYYVDVEWYADGTGTGPFYYKLTVTS
jgi:hypothetical protein